MTLPTAPTAPLQTRVSVRAPARLHLGFLDPSGSLGRRFGSLGLVIADAQTVVEIGPAVVDQLSAGNAAAALELPRARAHLAALRRHTGLEQPLALHLRQVLPVHAGLGSGTQLALAVARAFASWHDLDLPTPTLAGWLGRGLRSGAGIAGFDRGGLLLDAGPTASGAPAPLLLRLAFPADWRIVLVLDPRQQGLSGAAERQALAELPGLARADAAELCHEVLMRVLPGTAEADFGLFAAGLNRIQALLGAHFAPAQRGSPYASPAVGRLMQWMARDAPTAEAPALGQSSWGPTAFAILPSAASAAALIEAAQAAGVVDPGLCLRSVPACNHGARIDGGPLAGAWA